MTDYDYDYDSFDGMTREDELALLRCFLNGWKWPPATEFQKELDKACEEEDEEDEEDKQDEELY